MKELVPLKIVVGTKANGHYDWPDFNSVLPAAALTDPNDQNGPRMDWAIFIDVHGGCMHYDKIQNIGKGADTEIAMMCVPAAFAVAADAAFPNVEIVTEAELEQFFDTKSKVNMPEDFIDEERLNGLAARRSLLILRGENQNSKVIMDLDSEISDALDPDNTKPGVRKNLDRLWKDFKATREITIVTPT